MKKLLAAIFISGLLSTGIAKAQIKINLNLNVDSQPDWGPTGYDHAEYYYLPDIDCYYDVPNQQYVYLNGKNWTRSASLPSRYKNYDLYNSYKVVINEKQPYLHDATYRTKYAGYKGRRNQPVIRDSRDNKYQKARNNRPQQNHQQPDRQQPQQQRHDNGNRPGNRH